MKKIILYLLLFMLVLCYVGHAQTIDKSKLPNYQPYVGTWAGSDGADSLVVKLEKKVEYFKPLDIDVDRLYGKIYYYRNGKLLNNNFNTEKSILESGGLRKKPNGEPKSLRFLFKDLKKEKQGRAFLFFKDSSHKIAQWELRAMEGSFINRKIPEGYYEFSIPKEMTLRKIE